MNIFGTVRSWNRQRQTRTELYALTNRELADLGITRSDIPRIARQAQI